MDRIHRDAVDPLGPSHAYLLNAKQKRDSSVGHNSVASFWTRTMAFDHASDRPVRFQLNAPFATFWQTFRAHLSQIRQPCESRMLKWACGGRQLSLFQVFLHHFDLRKSRSKKRTRQFGATAVCVGRNRRRLSGERGIRSVMRRTPEEEFGRVY